MSQDSLSRLRDKLPELMVEGVSVLFAVLLALAVNQCQESRRNSDLAQTARQAVLDEVAANRAELLGNRAENEEMLGVLQEALAKIREGEEGEARIDWQISLLSTSAWSTSQVTRAVHFLPYEWVAKVSRLYELQDLWERRQDVLVERIAAVQTLPEDDPVGPLKPVLSAVQVVLGLEQGLVDGYDELLALDESPRSAAQAP